MLAKYFPLPADRMGDVTIYDCIYVLIPVDILLVELHASTNTKTITNDHKLVVSYKAKT